MKLKIDGDINQSYVQNLCLMFFPCEKFSESEEETDETPKAYVKLERLEKGYRAKVILTVLEKQEESTVFVADNPLYKDRNIAQMAVGGAFYEAGSRMSKYNPPWGILVGISTGKVAMRLYEQ